MLMTVLYEWENGVLVEGGGDYEKNVMIKYGIRRILCNGKPQAYSRESLVIPLSDLSTTVS